MVLRSGHLHVAIKLQEAADIMHSDVRSRLSDAVNDAHKGTGTWASYIDHNGDGESGDVIYSANGDIKKAPYEIQTQGGKAVASVDTANSANVVPCTSYQEETDDDDNYASMMEAKFYTKGDKPVIERFISKDERSSASDDSFAGKGKSFPILKAGDVTAAVRSMGRAGSDNYGPAALKANIIRIAKAKGLDNELPKTWRGTESAKPAPIQESLNVGGTLKLSESVAFPADITIREAFTATRQIKLIAPGQGSSAFYPAEVLKRDGPKVFKAGTPMRIDHPTRAEEAARPEGSVKDWGAVLAKDAYWLDDHKQGPGLYSEIKPFSDHAQTIEEKGAYAGVSIRANGHALMEAGKPVMKNGVPVLASITSAEGVDMVTRAGAGGMFLSESARAANLEEVSDMDAQKLEKLQESLTAGLATLALREARIEAKEQAFKALEAIQLPGEAKEEILLRVLESIPMKDGLLDETKFQESLKSETQRMGRLAASLTGRGRVIGMGAAEPVQVDPKLREAQLQREKDDDAESVAIFESFGLSKNAATAASKGRAA